MKYAIPTLYTFLAPPESEAQIESWVSKRDNLGTLQETPLKEYDKTKIVGQAINGLKNNNDVYLMEPLRSAKEFMSLLRLPIRTKAIFLTPGSLDDTLKKSDKPNHWVSKEFTKFKQVNKVKVKQASLSHNKKLENLEASIKGTKKVILVDLGSEVNLKTESLHNLKNLPGNPSTPKVLLSSAPESLEQKIKIENLMTYHQISYESLVMGNPVHPLKNSWEFVETAIRSLSNLYEVTRVISSDPLVTLRMSQLKIPYILSNHYGQNTEN